MSNPGFFNHYDDPDDEYWDDPPSTHGYDIAPPSDTLISTPESARRSVTASPNSLVQVNLGDDRLPTSVTLHKQLARVAEPSEYGKLIIDAYNHSLYAKDLEKAENGQSIRTMPKLREITAALLQTRRYTDYIELYNDFLGSREHTVGGPGQTRWGEPSVVIRASTARLFDVRIDPEWASRNSMLTIADDIIACCNTIRARQPTIVHDQYLSQETDDEVISRLIKHCQQLLRNEI